jgi:hypothetical protein
MGGRARRWLQEIQPLGLNLLKFGEKYYCLRLDLDLYILSHHRSAAQLRGCLFGLFVAFHRNKQVKPNKGVGFAAGFSKATVRNTQARESTYRGASRSFDLKPRIVMCPYPFHLHYLQSLPPSLPATGSRCASACRPFPPNSRRTAYEPV